MRSRALELALLLTLSHAACSSEVQTARDAGSVGDLASRDGRVEDKTHDGGTRPSDGGSKPSEGGSACTVASLDEIDVRALASKTKWPSALKLGALAMDTVGRRLYLGGSKTATIVVINMDTDSIEKVVDIGRAPNFLVRDSASGKLYAFVIPGAPATDECYEVDLASKALTSVAVATCQTLMDATHGPDSLKWQGYNLQVQGFVSQLGGFQVGWRQDLSGAFGVIKIVDSTAQELGEIVFGPDAQQTAIDQTTGKLYTSNTGDGSVSIFDLKQLPSTSYCKNNSCWVKDLDVGDSIGAMTLDPAGTLYVLNRLGGSAVYKVDLGSKTLTALESVKHLPQGIGLWPTGLALSADQKKLHVLSHYGSLLDVVDTATLQVSNTIRFYPDHVQYQARTDSISSLAFNAKTNTAYAVFPELGTIVATDVSQGKVTATVDLVTHGLDLKMAANAGPAVVVLAVNQKTDQLLAYLQNEHKLLVLNGSTLAKEKEATISLVPLQGLEPGSLVSNDEKGLVYVANKILDGSTLQETGTLSSGRKVIAFDNATDAVYTTEAQATGKSTETLAEHVYRFTAGKLDREWILDEIINVPSTFIFDLPKRVFYVGYFETARVKKYDLTAGCTPSGGGPGPQGLCGDGTCDDIEQQSGKCPQDCSK